MSGFKVKPKHIRKLLDRASRAAWVAGCDGMDPHASARGAEAELRAIKQGLSKWIRKLEGEQ